MAYAYYTNLTGLHFGYLAVTGPSRGLNLVPLNGFWDCKCQCGNRVDGVRTNSLRSGRTKSCGCLRKLNAGRPKIDTSVHPSATISCTGFIENNFQHFNAMRTYLKEHGVVVRSTGFYTAGGRTYGPYKNAIYALAEAMKYTLINDVPLPHDTKT